MSRPSTSRPVDHDVRETRVDRGSAGSAASSRRRDRRGDTSQTGSSSTSPLTSSPTSSWSNWAEADAPATRSERRRGAERPAAERPATTRRALRTDGPRTQAHHARSHRGDVHLDLDEHTGALSGPRTRHVKERRRHAAPSDPGMAADSATTATGRAQARAQRSGRRRSRRLRTVGALTLTVLGVTTAAMATNELRFSPFSDDAATVQQQVGAMAPIPDDERHRRPRQSVAVTVPTPEESTTKAKPKRTRTATATREASTGSGRPGVVLDGRMMGGWYNGASGIGVTNGEFSKWLGQPLTLAATWADTSDEVQRTLSPLQGEYGDWQGGLDIAVGGTILGSGENYAEAARGAYDDRWRAAAQVLAEKRKGKKGPTFVRPFHEMNCDWYQNWTVTRDNSADYKAAFKRYVNILRQGLPELYVAFSPNYGTCNGLPISDWYPGDDVVDVIAPDYYNDYQDEANGSVSGWNDESDKKDGQGNPVGPEAWRQFAAAHGKPLAFPEVGLKPSSQGGGDRPEWIKALNSWMTKHQNTATWQIGQDIPKAAAGKVLYFAYFNVEHDGDAGFTIFGGGANQNSAPVYQGLKWGNNRVG